MTDAEIIVLADAVSAAMRNLSDIKAQFGASTDEYAVQYKTWDDQRAVVTEAERVLSEAKAALDAGLAMR